MTLRRGVGRVAGWVAVLLGGPALAAAQVAAAQGGSAGDPHGFVLRTATDTVALERVRGGAGDAAGDLLLKAQRVRLSWRWTDGAASPRARLAFTVRGMSQPATAPPLQEGTFAFEGDSAVALVRNGGGAPQRTTRAARSGVGFFLNPSMALLETALRGALLRGAAQDTVWVMIASGAVLPVPMRRTAPDSVVTSLGGVEVRLQVDAQGRVLGGRIPAQGLVLERRPWFTDAALAVAPPDYSAPAGAPYTAEAVTIPTPMGHTLACTFTRPSAPGRVPALVLFTGSGPQERDEYLGIGDYRPFRQLADTLGRRGIAVLRCDDRGTGASGGDHATATSADFARDGAAQVAWLAGRADVRAIAVGGHSEGGLLAPMVAATSPAVRAVVLLAGPAYTGRRILQYQTVDIVRTMPGLTPGARDSALARGPALRDSLLASTPWMRFFATYDPLPTVRRLRVPVLILQGATDRQVTPEQADTLAAALQRAGNRQVTVRVFPQTNHLFLRDSLGWGSGYAALRDFRIPGDITGLVADWLGTTLGVGRPGAP